MNLYLLRHGIAADPGTAGITRDRDRPLTLEGRDKMRRSAAAMRALKLEFDLIISSPFVRARQTAEIVAAAFGAEDRLEFETELGCGGDARLVIQGLAARQPAPGAILLVGHEPDLSRMISVLLSGDPGLAVTMKKGSLCKLVAAPLRPGRCATLEWLLTPKQMLCMAR
jgi:phosphohistidine phosphatase